MTQLIRSPNASSAPIRSYDKVDKDVALKTHSAPEACKVFKFGDFVVPGPGTPALHVAIGDLVAKWEAVPERQAAMALARGWVADTLHADDGVTLRTLRMKKGMSQQLLAASIGTSQPHIARIEGGADSLNIDTCRRLANALDVDLNTLNDALIRQQSLNDKKQR